MDDIEAGLRPLLVHPPAPPRPVEVIATRARHRRVRRHRIVALSLVALVGLSTWGASRVTPRDGSSIRLSPADASEPSEPSVTPAGTPTAPPPGPQPVDPVLSSTIEDTAIGVGNGLIEYTGGSWTRCGGCNIPTDDSSYYYGYEAGDSYTVRFAGVQLLLYAPDDLHGGVALVSVDGQAAATPTVDFLTAGMPTNQQMWDSGLLEDGAHEVTFTIQPGDVAGDNQVVLFDRAEVYTLPAGPPTPEEPPPPLDPALGLLGAGVHDASEFSAWLGRPVDIWETWQPHSWAEMVGLPTVHQYMTGEGSPPFDVRWTGEVSFGQPMWAAGQDADACTRGDNDDHMATIGQGLVDLGFGDAYIRLGWEMDGEWFKEINAAWPDPEGWVACWRRWHGILKGISPDFRMVWNPNYESNTGDGPFDVRTVWPGDAFVDVAGPDYYDWDIDPDSTGFNGAPRGINRWVDFVVTQHHKPFAMPEWALDPAGGGDDPGFVHQVFDVLDQLKTDGTLAYASYFALGDCIHQVHVDGCNPEASEAYRARARAF